MPRTSISLGLPFDFIGAVKPDHEGCTLNRTLFLIPPLFVVRFDFLGGRMGLDGFGSDSELLLWMGFKHAGVDPDILLEDLRNGTVFKNGTPWAFGFARRAINALLRLNKELFVIIPILDRQTVDAIDGTHFDARSILTISTKAGNNPGHDGFSFPQKEKGNAPHRMQAT